MEQKAGIKQPERIKLPDPRMNSKQNLVIGIYFHPEAYPPTLNAIGELSSCFQHIAVVHRPHLQGKWQYPYNVAAFPAGSYISSVEQQRSSLLRKVTFFLQFVRVFLLHCRKERPGWILLYDNMSLFAYSIAKKFLRFPHKVWYHNHDVVDGTQLRKYSIGWFAARAEKEMFPQLNVFSLPSNDRRKYFPMEQFTGKYFFIPNYPAIKFYSRYYKPRVPEKTIRLIFQGQVGPGHGIEQILPLLKEEIAGHNIQMVLKGPCMEDYKRNIEHRARELNVTGSVQFVGVTPYAEVPEVSSRCHIGIGIFATNDIMNTTLGTASNKLYEYAAVGLPVLYYNSGNFTRYLDTFSWAVPTALDTGSIRKALAQILEAYPQLTVAAHHDFLNSLNFEKGFSPVMSYLKNEVSELA
jgi:hypothetical protein